MTDTDVLRRKKTESRKTQLIQIAAKIFAEEGYAETGIERISKEAGITGPALYRHFSSKQDILDTICVEATHEALETAQAIQAERDLTAEKKLKKLLRTRLDYVFGPSGASHYLTVRQKAHLSASARDQISGMQQEISAIMEAWLKQVRHGADDAEIKVASFAVQNMVLHTTWRIKGLGVLPEDDLKNLLEEMAWNTLLA